MHIGQRVAYIHGVPGKSVDRRVVEEVYGDIVFISPHGWATVRNTRDYRESVWLQDMREVEPPPTLAETVGEWIREAVVT